VQELAESGHDPHLDSSLSSTRERFSSDGTTPHPVAGTWKTLNQGLLSGSYDLDFWGKNAAAVDAAIGRARAAEVDAQAVRLMISSAVVQAYIAFDQTARQLVIEKQLLEQQKQLLGLTQRRLAAEIDSKVDLTQSEASLPATRANIAALNESMELSRNRVAALLGKGPDRGADIAQPHLGLPPSTAIPSTLTADLIGRRPDVVAQRWRVEASSRDIDLAKARFYPDVNITAFLGLQSLGFPKFDQASSRILGIGPAITLPIFDGGRLRANLAAQDATYDLAVEAYNQTLLDAVQDIADQLSSLKWLQERLAEQRQAVATANQADDLSQKRYAGGLGTFIQVLTTQNAVLAQRRQLVVLESRAFSLQANLSRALVGGYAPSADEQHAAAY
jgi:NodT family efflux transporter outer membrane factor (OMF) lipoprotein